jgi:hypothetical protein
MRQHWHSARFRSPVESLIADDGGRPLYAGKKA